MRNRYFSPENSTSSIQLSLNNSQKLRWLGSTTKLQSYHSTIEQSDRRIGNYSYDTSKEIGAGYSSKVYKAYSSKDVGQYAIKVVELKKYSASSLQMLQNEIQILRNLDHPNIIKCYDIYKTSTHCYIVTEYCGNGDLLNYLTRRGKLQQSVAIQIMEQVIEGLKYLMQLGILHRDLKPANILNNKKNWKIADFGFAIYSEGDIKTRYNVGTPLYMPPEALVKNIYSPLSDIFSIGVIFYQLLTGITPWECKSQKELIKKMSTLPFTISERHKISPNIKQILESLCSIEVEKRLTKSQFLNLKIKKTQNQNPEQLRRLQSSKRLQRNQSYNPDQLLKSTSSLSIQQNKSLIQETLARENRIEAKNNHILINQLHYCRFIYYMTKNISNILVSNKSRNKVALILYRHLQKLIAKLSDDKQNWFKLKSWDKFKQSKKYHTTHLTMKQYSVRYEKQYLNFLKNADANIIKEINKDIIEFTSQEHFSVTYYRNLLSILAPIIRQFNHNLTLTINKNETQLTSDVRGQIEGIKTLYKFYKLVQFSMDQFENFESFEKKSEIKVQIDYRSATGVSLQQFLQLRQQLKFV